MNRDWIKIEVNSIMEDKILIEIGTSKLYHIKDKVLVGF